MTTLRPPYEIALTHAGNSVVLRASLRAAVTIDNLDGGFPAVLNRLAQGHLSTVKATIRAAATDRQDAERLLAGLDGHPLRPFMDDAEAGCIEIIAAILPEPTEPTGEATTPAKPSKAEGTGWHVYLSSLYAHATGWMGWTPDTAWNASPAEIEAAFAAHVDRLIAMNGGKRDDDEDETTGATAGTYTPERLAEIEELGHDPAFQRDKLRALKMRMG